MRGELVADNRGQRGETRDSLLNLGGLVRGVVIGQRTDGNDRDKRHHHDDLDQRSTGLALEVKLHRKHPFIIIFIRLF
ncbi:hypothetical protein D3C85_1788700 [compost metagenome]